MGLEIIKGGLTPEEEKQKKVRIERLKICLGHIRAIENSISITRNMAAQIGWKEFDDCLLSCHSEIKNTLIFVKKTSKKVMVELHGRSNPKTTKLKVAINNTITPEKK